MKRAYICHPYTADPEGNIVKVRDIVERLSKASVCDMLEIGKRPGGYNDYDKVYVPVSPMLAFPDFMSEAGGVSREHAMAFCLALLDGCDEIWVCSRNISEGMAEEISHASEKGLKIVFQV